jgi:hypothetical protein
MSDSNESYLNYIDDATRERLVGALLYCDEAAVICRHSKEIDAGEGGGTRLYRVVCSAERNRGRLVAVAVF